MMEAIAEIQAAALEAGEPVSAACAYAIALRLGLATNHAGNMIWRAIPGHEGHYEASNKGDIRSVSRLEPGQSGKQRWRPGKILTQFEQQPPRLPYRRVGLTRNGKTTTFSVARLVCLAFHGKPASDALQTAHLDNNPTNDTPENLAWTTAKENLDHQLIFGTRPLGEAKALATLNDEIVRKIRELARPDFRARKIANQLGVSTAAVHQVLVGNTWKHVT